MTFCNFNIWHNTLWPIYMKFQYDYIKIVLHSSFITDFKLTSWVIIPPMTILFVCTLLTSKQKKWLFVRIQLHLTGNILSIEVGIPLTMLLVGGVVTELVRGPCKWNPEKSLHVISTWCRLFWCHLCFWSCWKLKHDGINQVYIRFFLISQSSQRVISFIYSTEH